MLENIVFISIQVDNWKKVLCTKTLDMDVTVLQNSDQPGSGPKTGKLKITSTVNYAEREKKTCLQNAELTWH